MLTRELEEVKHYDTERWLRMLERCWSPPQLEPEDTALLLNSSGIVVVKTSTIRPQTNPKLDLSPTEIVVLGELEYQLLFIRVNGHFHGGGKFLRNGEEPIRLKRGDHLYWSKGADLALQPSDRVLVYGRILYQP